MKRRDEAGRAERGPFSTGLAGQAARQAGSQAQSSIYAQMPPPFAVQTTRQLSQMYCSEERSPRGKVERAEEISRTPLPTSFLPLFHAIRLAHWLLLPPIQSRLIWDLIKMLNVKDSPSICLSPAFFAFCVSSTLFGISLSIFHLVVVTLSNDSIYVRKQCPIYLELGKE